MENMNQAEMNMTEGVTGSCCTIENEQRFT